MSKLEYLKQNYFLSPVNLFLSIGVLLLTFGCINTSDEKNVTYFGGKIKNPKGEYVYFAKNLKFIDSAKIDSYNKFSFELDSLELGLYSFHHGPELQFIYLEPRDSLLLYLNTWDFDESLIYSGNQAAKNNYLISSWLQQEKFEKNFNQNYLLNEKEFSKVIESEIKNQLESYNNLVELEGEEPSDFFKKLANVGIYYPLYTLKEYYPLKNKKGLNLKSLPKLSDDFYSYRKTIDLNDDDLRSYYPYRKFVSTYLGLNALKEYLNNPKDNNTALIYMKLVTKEVKSESYKNELLAKKFWGSLSNSHISEDDFKKISDYFFENCTNKDICSEIKKSIVQKEKLRNGDKLPKIIALDVNGDEVIVNNIAKNNIAVIYFWPKNSTYVEYLEEKLASLQMKYPEVLFIGIERDKTNEDWIKFVESKKLSKDNQFILAKNTDAYAYFEGDMARTVIVNNSGNIHEGYLFFNNANFEYHIKKLNKQ